MPITEVNPEDSLFIELSELIDQSQKKLISQANSALVVLFWHIGIRINAEILQHKRAEYGKRIVVTLSRQLAVKIGRNFEEKEKWAI